MGPLQGLMTALQLPKLRRQTLELAGKSPE